MQISHLLNFIKAQCSWIYIQYTELSFTKFVVLPKSPHKFTDWVCLPVSLPLSSFSCCFLFYFPTSLDDPAPSTHEPWHGEWRGPGCHAHLLVHERLPHRILSGRCNDFNGPLFTAGWDVDFLAIIVPIGTWHLAVNVHRITPGIRHDRSIIHHTLW